MNTVTVENEFLDKRTMLPLVLRPSAPEKDLLLWSKGRREFIFSQLKHYGAILFRGFEVGEAEGFQAFIQSVSGSMMGYQDRATPRSQVSGNIFTATDYPPGQRIFLHNESSFAFTWPSKLFFYCMQPAEEGGETPIADMRRVFQRIAPEVRRRFIEKGVMYVRNFGDRIFGLPWQTVFQTEDKNELENYCRAAGISTDWKDEKRLRTRQVRAAVIKHPQTGETVWFNHAATLHFSTIEEKLRAMLLKMFKEEDLPNNAYYGDGTRIEPEIIQAVRNAYEAEETAFTWQRGDVLMLDNMLVSHGRRAFKGKRKVVVGMADPLTRDSFEGGTHVSA